MVMSSIPAADNASSWWSSSARPFTGSRHLGVCSLSDPNLVPRPAANRTARLTGMTPLRLRAGCHDATEFQSPPDRRPFPPVRNRPWIAGSQCFEQPVRELELVVEGVDADAFVQSMRAHVLV